MGLEAEQFAMVNNLSRLIDLPMSIPDRTGDHGHTLDLILTSTIITPPLLTHRIVVSLSHPSNLPATILYPSHDTFWCYNSVDWDGSRYFIASHPWNDCCFTPDISTSVSDLTDMNSFYPTFLRTRHTRIPRVT